LQRIIEHKKNKYRIKVLFTFLGEDFRKNKLNIQNRKKKVLNVVAISKQISIEKLCFLGFTKQKDLRNFINQK
jgi:hypothetical protein